MDKIRGFERISNKQFKKDFIFYIREYEIKTKNIKNITKLKETIIKLPKRATAKSAGYDIFSPTSFELKLGEEIKLPTGIKAYMQLSDVLMVYPRSGLGFKYYTRLANTIGIIDSDYFNNESNEGHIWIKLRNEGDKVLKIEQGEAIAQFVFQKYLLADGDSFEGEERKGGFGSTDSK